MGSTRLSFSHASNNTASSRLNEDNIYLNFIKPQLEKRFINADCIMLAGSHGRLLNDGERLPKKNSDYDFVIFYENLPEDFPSCMFSSMKVETAPGEYVSLDFKIYDREGLNDHIQETKYLRRFPFLFNMIMDGHVIFETAGSGLSQKLKEKARRVLEGGPALLTKSQLDSEIKYIKDLENAIESCDLSREHLKQAMAFECLDIISKKLLRSEIVWESCTNRTLDYLSNALPEEFWLIMPAYEKALNGNFSAFKKLTSQITQTLEQYKQHGHYIEETGHAQNEADRQEAVHPEILKQSNINAQRIMIDQYLDRLEDIGDRGYAYEIATKAALWMALKSNIAAQADTASAPGSEKLNYLDQQHFADGHLSAFLTALKDHDIAACRTLAEKMLENIGAFDFEYIERIYPADLGKRILRDPERYEGYKAPQLPSNDNSHPKPGEPGL